MFHLINAADGCAFARDHGAVAIVVDTLRASTTVAIFLERAKEVVVVRSVEDARAFAAERPGSLLAGERNGLPPEGFDLGNSPVAARRFRRGQETGAELEETGAELEETGAELEGRTVIFTSTTGAARAVAVVGSYDSGGKEEEGRGGRRREEEKRRNLIPFPPLPSPSLPFKKCSSTLFMGAPVNASAVARAARDAAEAHQCDVVIIPAGHVDDDHGTGPEDAAGATVIGLALQDLGIPPAPGTTWAFDPLPSEQIPHRAAEMIRTSPHAHLLYALGAEFAADVDFCCRLNETDTVPRCVGTVPLASGEVGVVFADAKR